MAWSQSDVFEIWFSEFLHAAMTLYLGDFFIFDEIVSILPAARKNICWIRRNFKKKTSKREHHFYQHNKHSLAGCCPQKCLSFRIVLRKTSIYTGANEFSSELWSYGFLLFFKKYLFSCLFVWFAAEKVIWFSF